jgi:hypothetical protein
MFERGMHSDCVSRSRRSPASRGLRLSEPVRNGCARELLARERAALPERIVEHIGCSLLVVEHCIFCGRMKFVSRA